MSGSTKDWIAPSMYGRSQYQPYLASSYARSRYSIDRPDVDEAAVLVDAALERRVDREVVEGEVHLGATCPGTGSG